MLRPLNINRKPHTFWGLNLHLLTDKKFCDYLKNQILLYFEINYIPETSPNTLWEAFKAYIRGSIISFEASKRKENMSKLKDLEEQIKALNQEDAQSPSITLQRKITILKYEFNQIMSVKISKAFLYTRQKFFEIGDKPHKLLACQLHKMENDRTIHKVKASDNTILTQPKHINNRFLEFYTDLYTSKSNSESETINTFLDKCNLSRIDDEDCKSLNAALTINESQLAVTSLKGNKSPGPDGLPGELYKTYDEK